MDQALKRKTGSAVAAIGCLRKISELGSTCLWACSSKSSGGDCWAEAEAAPASATCASALREIFIQAIIALLHLQRFESSLLHSAARRRFAGPDLELPPRLLDEHLD